MGSCTSRDVGVVGDTFPLRAGPLSSAPDLSPFRPDPLSLGTNHVTAPLHHSQHSRPIHCGVFPRHPIHWYPRMSCLYPRWHPWMCLIFTCDGSCKLYICTRTGRHCAGWLTHILSGDHPAFGLTKCARFATSLWSLFFSRVLSYVCRYSADEIHFNLMAIVSDRKMTFSKRIEEITKQIQVFLSKIKSGWTSIPQKQHCLRLNLCRLQVVIPGRWNGNWRFAFRSQQTTTDDARRRFENAEIQGTFQ